MLFDWETFVVSIISKVCVLQRARILNSFPFQNRLILDHFYHCLLALRVLLIILWFPNRKSSVFYVCFILTFNRNSAWKCNKFSLAASWTQRRQKYCLYLRGKLLLVLNHFVWTFLRFIFYCIVRHFLTHGEHTFSICVPVSMFLKKHELTTNV